MAALFTRRAKALAIFVVAAVLFGAVGVPAAAHEQTKPVERTRTVRHPCVTVIIGGQAGTHCPPPTTETYTVQVPVFHLHLNAKRCWNGAVIAAAETCPQRPKPTPQPTAAPTPKPTPKPTAPPDDTPPPAPTPSTPREGGTVAARPAVPPAPPTTSQGRHYCTSSLCLDLEHLVVDQIPNAIVTVACSSVGTGAISLLVGGGLAGQAPKEWVTEGWDIIVAGLGDLTAGQGLGIACENDDDDDTNYIAVAYEVGQFGDELHGKYWDLCTAESTDFFCQSMRIDQYGGKHPTPEELAKLLGDSDVGRTLGYVLAQRALSGGGGDDDDTATATASATATPTATPTATAAPERKSFDPERDCYRFYRGTCYNIENGQVVIYYPPDEE